MRLSRILQQSVYLAALYGSVPASITAQLQRAPESESTKPLTGEATRLAGQKTYVANCSFCHGLRTEGGARGGPDLRHSPLITADDQGKQFAAFLKVGRPDKGMPAFQLPETIVRSMNAFLRSVAKEAAAEASDDHFERDVRVGDAAAGRAFFAGPGNCHNCHSVTGDLKGIGTKYPPSVLQGKLVLPIGDGGYPGFFSEEPPRTRVTLTMANGETQTGLLVFLSDYAITWNDASGIRRTLPRHGDSPKLSFADPLQAHLDRQLILTDRQMHDLTAYLATLK